MAKKGTFSAEDREALSGVLGEVVRLGMAGQISPEAIPFLEVVRSGRLDMLQFVDPFAQYAPLLPSLEDQLKLWYRYNEELLGRPISDDVFADVNTASDHVQSVTDFLHFVLIFGTDRELFEAGALIIKENVSNFTRGGSLGSGYDIRPLADRTLQYEAGIHAVHTNLVAHWEPEDGRSVDDVRVQAKTAEEKLGYIEPLQAYGLAPKLLQKMDGTNFPYSDLAGYEVKPSGESGWRNAPYLYGDVGYSDANLSSYRTGSRYQDCAAPVVWES